MKIAVLACLLLIAGLIGMLLYGAYTWRSHTSVLESRLQSGRAPVTPSTYSMSELDDLPAPVQRYFKAVLKNGQPMITAVSVDHTGSFNMSESGEQWKAFSSSQRVTTRRPGFVWDARITMAPGLKARVHDAYIGGEGILHATLLGLFSVVDLRGAPQMAHGELMRFVAEAAWYPTALLPSQGVRWEAVDNSSARATLKDGDTTLTLLFRFHENGLIDTVKADARERSVGGAFVSTPWHGRFWNYAVRGGMLIPLDGEVAWQLPDGPLPYWRGHIECIDYEFAQ